MNPAGQTNKARGTPKRATGKRAETKAAGSPVGRNVVAARDKIIGGVTSSINAVLLTRKNIEEVIDEAVGRGRMTHHDAQEMIQNLLQRGARATSDVAADIERLVGRSSGSVDLDSDTELPLDSEANLPITGYDTLSAAKVQEQLLSLTPAQLRKIRDYERRHANRKTVLDPIDRKLR
jgi:polyhydroxyalkanoate synthesis regulator phasin